MKTCGNCTHFKPSEKNKSIGRCCSPIPYYVKLMGDAYDWVAVNDGIAMMCSCYEDEKESEINELKARIHILETSLSLAKGVIDNGDFAS